MNRNETNWGKIFLVPVITSIIITANLCSSAVDETEGANDSFKYPQKINPGKVVRGNLQTKTDRDIYTWQTSESSLIDITVSGMKGIDHRLAVYFESLEFENRWEGRLITVDDNPRQADETVSSLFVPAGHVFIEVSRSKSDPGQTVEDAFYLLNVAAVAADDVRYEQEDNGSKEKANPLVITAESLAAGNTPTDSASDVEAAAIEGNGAVNFNNLRTKKADTDWFEAVNRSNESVQVQFSIWPRGYDAGLETPDDSKPGKWQLYNFAAEDGLESTPRLVLGPGQRRLFRVSPQSEGRGEYRWELRYHKANPFLESEPNNDRASAQAFDKNEIGAELYPASEKDWFSAPLPATTTGTRPVLVLESPEKWKGRLTLVVDKLTRQTVEREPSMLLQVVSPPVNKSSGRLLFMVESSDEDWGSRLPYKLYFKNIETAAAYESEPNDEVTLASLLPASGSLQGRLSQAADRDCFMLHKEVNKKLTIENGADFPVVVTLLGDSSTNSLEVGSGSSTQVETTAAHHYLCIKPLSFIPSDDISLYTIK